LAGAIFEFLRFASIRRRRFQSHVISDATLASHDAGIDNLCQAQMAPNIRMKTNRSRSFLQWTVACVAIVLAAVAGVIYPGFRDADPAVEVDREQVTSDAAAIHSARDALRQNLYAPDSAVFQDEAVYRLEPVEAGDLVTCGWVDARNAAGTATQRRRYFAVQYITSGPPSIVTSYVLAEAPDEIGTAFISDLREHHGPVVNMCREQPHELPDVYWRSYVLAHEDSMVAVLSGFPSILGTDRK
jgi:hypothetical protein